MSGTVKAGIVRPPQIKEKSHTYESVYTTSKEGEDSEHHDVWKIQIDAVDNKITDFLARLVSGVLHTNNHQLLTLEEDVLKELGIWQEPEEQLSEEEQQDKVPMPSGTAAGDTHTTEHDTPKGDK
jgi:hypothetical protein|tara:strand:+ start:465 stop:839 length:375 start_codon:yes stop_codon:yes gene_type:complete